MKRLAYIDWMRGLACLLMFQTHCYDSWLSPQARNSAVYAWSQSAGTLPAPLFIFLSGISFALVTQRLREKRAPRNVIARTTIWRGAEIFGLGLLFRVQEFALGFRHVPWTDLLRVDVLNILGLSMILMGVLCWLTAVGPASVAKSNSSASLVDAAAPALASSRNHGIAAALCSAAAIAMATPPLWTTHRPSFLPWPMESYLNGVHIFDKPQPWLFPVFPWSAFAFAGLAVGFFLLSDLAKRWEGAFFAAIGGAGMLACVFSIKLDESRFRLYAAYDYWHTSPNFLLMRCGILLMILFLAYVWCRWGLAQVGFSPIIQLGSTSLLVYWVHIDFVYGGLSILPKRQCSVAYASFGLLVIFLAMLVVSVLRTRWKKRPATDSRKSSAQPPAVAGG